MSLTPQQKNFLVRKPAEEIASYVADGKITLEQLLELAQDNDRFRVRYDQVVAIIESRPKPEEIAAYEKVKAAVETAPDDHRTYDMVIRYIQEWEQASSAAEHVAEAKAIIAKMTERKAYLSLKAEAEAAIKHYEDTKQLPSAETITKFDNFITGYQRVDYAEDDVNDIRIQLCKLQEIITEKAEYEWSKLVDEEGKLRNIDDIKAFMKSMPVPEEILQKADDAAWAWVTLQPDIMDAVRKYEETFPNLMSRRHRGEVERMRQLEQQWQYACTTIPNIRRFLSENTGTPFETAAQARIKELTEATLEDIRRAPQLYTVENFNKLLDAGLDRDRLFEAAGLTEQMYNDNVRNYGEIKQALPPEPTAVTKYGTYVGERGVTDIVFFGISSSGKTCVLSGLLRNDKLRFARHLYSGDYGEILYEYAQKGFTLSGTAKDFVATIKAEVIPLGSREEYHFNLFEMAGEDFYDKIALNKTNTGYIVDIDDMGANAAKILKSQNDKVLFLVMDPTASGAIQDKQRETMEALVDLLFGEHEGVNPNADLMERVQGLHFIVTKSDMLPVGDVREKARDFVRQTFKKSLIDTIIAGCRKYGINVSSDSELDGRPRVFPFSLGKFTIGNMFTYNEKSSDEILQVICDYCTPRRKAGIGDRVRHFLTEPLI